MSAYIVDAATIDAVVAGAQQFRPLGESPSWAFYRFFRDTDTDRGGYSAHRFSPYAADDEAPEVFNSDTIGRELWAENVLSIHARYPDTIDGENLPGAGTFTEAEVMAYQYGPGARVANVDPLGAIGAIRGYEYQSCEHDGWKYSIAYAFTRQVTANIVDRLRDGTGSSAWTLGELGEIEGETHYTKGEEGAWTIRFTPGRNEAISLLQTITRKGLQ